LTTRAWHRRAHGGGRRDPRHRAPAVPGTDTERWTAEDDEKSSFYETCPVLAADEPIRSNRIALCQLTANTLKHGRGLLGIIAPERM
jgi:hypothetical protein